MDVKLVRVQTADGVGLDGALRLAPSVTSTGTGLDLVICHHGHGGNFYNPSFFDTIGDGLLAEGCAVLRVNSRGHDHVVGGPAGRLGSSYENVDDSRLDWKAWLDFAADEGYRRIGVWGHSLGAVKTIYYLAVERDPRIVCAIASSPPRFAYETYLASEVGHEFEQLLGEAQRLMADGQPEALIDATVPLPAIFAARTYVDKYGPGNRYDIFRHLPAVHTPLLVTLGSLEDGLAFRELLADGGALEQHYAGVRYRAIEGADHAYRDREAVLWSAIQGWLTEATRVASIT